MSRLFPPSQSRLPPSKSSRHHRATQEAYPSSPGRRCALPLFHPFMYACSFVCKTLCHLFLAGACECSQQHDRLYMGRRRRGQLRPTCQRAGMPPPCFACMQCAFNANKTNFRPSLSPQLFTTKYITGEATLAPNQLPILLFFFVVVTITIGTTCASASFSAIPSLATIQAYRIVVGACTEFRASWARGRMTARLGPSSPTQRFSTVAQQWCGFSYCAYIILS